MSLEDAARLAAVELALAETRARLEVLEEHLAGYAVPLLERDHQAMKERIRARGVRRALGGIR